MLDPGRSLRLVMTAGLAAAAATLVAFPGATSAQRWWDALPRPVYGTLDRVDVRSDWFEVYRVAPDVTAIYEPGHFEEALAYLIEGSTDAVLFDACLGIGDIKAVVEQLTDREPMVVVSHTHADHVGGAPSFSRVAVADSPFSRERLARGFPDLGRLITEESVWKPLPQGFDRATYAIPPLKPTRFLADGDVIDLGSRRLEVLRTPGHTPDSLCLLDRDSRLLFTGDTLYPSTLYAHTADSSFEDYVRTASRLGALARAVDHVMPGHNEARAGSELLSAMDEGFRRIADGSARPVSEREGVKRYEFDGFAVLVRR